MNIARESACRGLSTAGLLLVLGCHAPAPRPAADTGSPPAPPYTVAWGDLHAHTGLSHDGCEDPDHDCLPEGGGLPGEHLYAHAAATGLTFVAITDHAEWDRYQRPADHVDVDIWAQQEAAVQAAEGGAVLPVLGYEYTADFGHRTVVFDADEVCPQLRIADAGNVDGGKAVLGLEVYTPAVPSGYTTSQQFGDGMAAAALLPGCEGVRWLSWFHHPAMSPPRAVHWGDEASRLASDTVVEIASEHGSSECADLTVDGCAFRADAERYVPTASVQAALAGGYRLGFVGGSDNHAGTGVDLAGGGTIGELMDTDGDGLGDTPREQFTAGALTGVILDQPLTRTTLFDAVVARHTFAATWIVAGVRVHVVDAVGRVYLPGDDLAPGTWQLVAALDDPTVDSWFAEVVDPATGLALPADVLTLPAGEVRYVRFRAWVGGVEQRVWASPFFAAE